MGVAARPRIRTTRSANLSSLPKKRKMREQVVEDTLDLVREKFSTMTREEQSAMTARISAIKVR
jgi:hypothetical protein